MTLPPCVVSHVRNFHEVAGFRGLNADDVVLRVK